MECETMEKCALNTQHMSLKYQIKPHKKSYISNVLDPQFYSQHVVHRIISIT